MSDLWMPEGVRLPSGLVIPPVAGGADFPPNFNLLASSNVVSTYGKLGLEGATGLSQSGGSANSIANRAFYVPVRILKTMTITQIGLHIGASGTNNMDLGLYTWDGTRLFSTGATAIAVASQMQWVNITDFQIGPGLFYAAAVCDANQPLLRIIQAVALSKMMGMLQQTSAYPLPATATFATAAAGFLPLIALSQGTVV